MTDNKLKFNPDKIKFLLIETVSKRIDQVFAIDLLVSLVSPSNNAKNPGVSFDSNFAFSDHVFAVCRACFIKIRTLTHIHRYLNLNTATMLANTLVNNCNNNTNARIL